jgi:predicted site-specific integrase-resolvase
MKAIIYCRTACDTQSGVRNIERQATRSLRFALKKGYSEIVIMTEVASANLSEKRKAFIKLLNRVEKRDISSVIVSDPERISRSFIERQVIREMFKENSADLKVVSQTSHFNLVDEVAEALKQCAEDIKRGKVRKNIESKLKYFKCRDAEKK